MAIIIPAAAQAAAVAGRVSPGVTVDSATMAMPQEAREGLRPARPDPAVVPAALVVVVVVVAHMVHWVSIFPRPQSVAEMAVQAETAVSAAAAVAAPGATARS
ncbi:hypothetical protein HOP51_10100 [Halomonas sp. MCCC 1A11036]|uniref:Energy transducer TonB n=1 Tax=Billgrantia zhangzhouensis TaxID=2733481 RepID=A0ABS9AFD3_9GAMM|nr:hypothetical protein [Halomonas zhangzhouensis]MCE8020456.1 hypothetical protein [Halomonas zhangzhouensis]